MTNEALPTAKCNNVLFKMSPVMHIMSQTEVMFGDSNENENSKCLHKMMKIIYIFPYLCFVSKANH